MVFVNQNFAPLSISIWPLLSEDSSKKKFHPVNPWGQLLQQLVASLTEKSEILV